MLSKSADIPPPAPNRSYRDKGSKLQFGNLRCTIAKEVKDYFVVSQDDFDGVMKVRKSCLHLWLTSSAGHAILLGDPTRGQTKLPEHCHHIGETKELL